MGGGPAHRADVEWEGIWKIAEVEDSPEVAVGGILVKLRGVTVQAASVGRIPKRGLVAGEGVACRCGPEVRRGNLTFAVMVRQEIWGYLLTHYAISALICTAATTAGIDPNRVNFKRTVRIIHHRAADPAFPPDQRQRVLARVIAGITGPKHLNKRRERSYPASSSAPATAVSPSRNPASTAPATTPRPPSNSPTPS